MKKGTQVSSPEDRALVEKFLSLDTLPKYDPLGHGRSAGHPEEWMMKNFIGEGKLTPDELEHLCKIGMNVFRAFDMRLYHALANRRRTDRPTGSKLGIVKVTTDYSVKSD